MIILDRNNRNEVRRLLNDYFSEAELRELCFELAIDYENLPGQTKREKIIELISYCERHGRISTFLRMCRRLRPFVDWPLDPETTVSEPNVTEKADDRQIKPDSNTGQKRSNRGLIVTVLLVLCLCCVLYAVVIATVNQGCLLPPPLNGLLPSGIRC